MIDAVGQNCYHENRWGFSRAFIDNSFPPRQWNTETNELEVETVQGYLNEMTNKIWQKTARLAWLRPDALLQLQSIKHRIPTRVHSICLYVVRSYTNMQTRNEAWRCGNAREALPAANHNAGHSSQSKLLLHLTGNERTNHINQDPGIAD